MDWIVLEKDELVKAAEVLDLVPQRAGIPSSDYVRVRTGKFGLEMSLASSVSGVIRVRAKIPEASEFFVDRRLFLPFVLMGKNWKGDFRTAFDERKWLLRQGSRRAEFAVRESKIGGYGVWRDKDGLKEIRLSENLKQLLRASFSCATSDPSLPQFNCVYLGGNLVMASNDTVLFVGVAKKKDDLKFPFPVEIIPLLSDGAVQGVGLEGDRVLLDCGLGLIEGSVSAVAQKQFPKAQLVQRVAEGQRWPLLAKLPAERLARLMTRLTNYLTGIRREDWMLTMEMSEGRLRASVRVTQGKFEEVMELEDGVKEGTVLWPLDQVQPVLEHIGRMGETLTVRVDEKKRTPYLISGAGVALMVARKL